jgi:hypothetical protein
MMLSLARRFWNRARLAQRLTKWLAALLAAVSVLAAAVILAWLQGASTIAQALLVGLLTVIFAGLVYVLRLIGRDMFTLRLELTQLAQSIDANQRRVLAAVEAERQAAANRQAILLASLEGALAGRGDQRG